MGLCHLSFFSILLIVKSAWEMIKKHIVNHITKVKQVLRNLGSAAVFCFTLRASRRPGRMYRPTGYASQAGFTLVELLVVVSILALFYGLIVANFSVWRGPQSIKVAANELATNINKLHSYSLSARSINGTPANYYIVQFNTGTANVSYPIQAISATSPTPTFINPVEIIRFPGLVYVKQLDYTNQAGTVTSPACVQIVFSLPYGRTYIDPNCSFNSGSTSKLLGELDSLTNTKLSIILGRPGIPDTKTIMVDAATGRVQTQ